MRKVLRRTSMMLVLMFCMVFLLVGCSERKFLGESEIVFAEVETRTQTDLFTGLKGSYPYLTYCYIQEDGALRTEELQLRDNYDGLIYEVQLAIGENKVERYQEGEKTIYEVYLTSELYTELFGDSQ